MKIFISTPCRWPDHNLASLHSFHGTFSSTFVKSAGHWTLLMWVASTPSPWTSDGLGLFTLGKHAFIFGLFGGSRYCTQTFRGTASLAMQFSNIASLVHEAWRHSSQILKAEETDYYSGYPKSPKWLVFREIPTRKWMTGATPSHYGN